MQALEKIITYGQAMVNPSSELVVFENNSKIKLKGIDDLVFLCHFNGDPGYIGQQFFSTHKEVIEGSSVCTGGMIMFDYNLKKFGITSLLNFTDFGPGLAMCPPPENIVFAPELAVDFWVRFPTLDTGGEQRSLVDRYRNYGAGEYSWQIFMTDGELGLKLHSTQGEFILQTSGLNLSINNWRHIRAAWSENCHLAKLFVDGAEVAGSGFSGTIRDSQSENYQSPLQILASTVTQNVWLDELRIFKAFLSEEFAPPSAATKPFSSNFPTAVLTTDAGYGDAVWIPEGLSFFDEQDFENEGIKIRIDADDDNSPSFSGQPLSLSQVRALPPLAGRRLHLEFTFISDGDTQRILSSGKIQIRPETHIVPRREPEIIGRF